MTWLKLDDRKKIRDHLSTLEGLILETRKEMVGRSMRTEAQKDLFNRFLAHEVRNADIDVQVEFVERYLTDADKTYKARILAQAADDITSYAEAINYEWFPARHHVLMLSKLQDVLECKSNRLIISLPVGHAKTVYASKVFPTYAIGRDPHERIITAGHTQRFVEKEIGQTVRRIIASDEFHSIFPQVTTSTETADSITFNPIRNTTEGRYVVKGAGSGISGYRASLIIADDLYPQLADAQNASYRQTVYNWFFGDLMTRRLPTTRVVLVCTRWHHQDIIGELLASAEAGTGDKWDTVIMPAICDDPETDPLGRKEGEPLWPEFFDKTYMENVKRSVPGKIWRCLYQGKPIAEDGTVVKASWFQYWDNLPDPKMVRRRFVAFDTADKTNSRSDYSAGTAWIQTHDNRYFLVDIMQQKLEYTELIRAINDFARKNKASAILLEDSAAGRSILSSMKGQMAAPMVPIRTENKTKSFRFEEVSPMFECGQVFLPRIHVKLDDLERELLEFPEGKHDDIVDSVTMALRWGKGSGVKRGVFQLIGVG